MNIQYITDKKGHKNVVQLTIKDWEQILDDLKELEKLREKKLLSMTLKNP